MSKGKDSFRANTKDAFAFFILIQFEQRSSPETEKERLRAKSLKDALAFADDYTTVLYGCQALF